MCYEVKPCPFCGGDPQIEIGGEHFTSISCKECGVRTPAKFGEDRTEKAITAWNTRCELWGVWLLHEDTNVWECSDCHTCFELGGGIPADRFITYCPVCGTRLYMPE